MTCEIEALEWYHNSAHHLRQVWSIDGSEITVSMGKRGVLMCMTRRTAERKWHRADECPLPVVGSASEGTAAAAE